MGNAVDMSNWGGELTDDEAACLARNDYSLVIASTFNRWIFRQQVDSAQRAGLRQHAYVFLTWGNAAFQTRDALSLLATCPVEMLWLDAEADQGNLSASDIINELQACVDLCARAGVKAGIYTRYGWWVDVVGNTTQFNHLPLWSAWYDNDADIDFDRVPYGGWSEVMIEQWGDTRTVCGQSVDVNTINDNYKGQDEMTPQQIQQLNDASAGLIRLQGDVDGLANALDALPALKNQLRYLYALAGKPWPFGTA